MTMMDNMYQDLAQALQGGPRNAPTNPIPGAAPAQPQMPNQAPPANAPQQQPELEPSREKVRVSVEETARTSDANLPPVPAPRQPLGTPEFSMMAAIALAGAANGASVGKIATNLGKYMSNLTAYDMEQEKIARDQATGDRDYELEKRKVDILAEKARRTGAGKGKGSGDPNKDFWDNWYRNNLPDIEASTDISGTEVISPADERSAAELVRLEPYYGDPRTYGYKVPESVARKWDAGTADTQEAARPSSKKEYDKLPKGALYYDVNGNLRKKGG